jgi:hypothetical protein
MAKSPFQFRVATVNTQELRIFLDAMPNAMQNKVMKPVIAALSSVGAKKMKSNLKKALAKAKAHRADKEERWTPTGALMASIGVKSPIRITKSGFVFGAFGVRRSQSFAKNKLVKVRKRIEERTTHGFKRVKRGDVTLATKKMGSKKSSDNEIRPSQYGHLLERGHKGPIRAQAYPFVEPTAVEMESVVASQAPSLARVRFPQVVAQESRRLSKRLKR